MVNVRVRGIYSTALTRLLLDNGFNIVQPSESVKARFNLTTSLSDDLKPDLDIYDRTDKQGVNIAGRVGSTNALVFLLQSTFDDVIVRRHFFISPEVSHQNRQVDSSNTAPSDEEHLDIEFPGASKRKLDILRQRISPTLDGHHYYKSCGGRVSSLLAMAEKMLEKGSPLKQVEDLFEETVEKEYPYEGSRIGIEHVKISGEILHLGAAQIENVNSEKNEFRLCRFFFREGVYDGLKTRKEPGDYALTNMRIGDWSFQTRYFSKDGEYKGTYININTPIELYFTKVRYVDLEVDLCLWPDGKVQRLDEEALDKTIRDGFISERLGQIAKGQAEEIFGSLSLGEEKCVSFTG